MGAVGRGGESRLVTGIIPPSPPRPSSYRRHLCHSPMPWFLLYAALHLCCRWTTELSQAGRLPNLEKPTVLENR